MKRTLIAIFFLTIISCGSNGNRKTKYGCDFDFFEKTSGIEFPEQSDIVDCYDSFEGIIWVNLKFEQKDAYEFIEKLEMHKYSNEINDEIDKLMGSRDNQLVEHLNMFMSDSIQPITNDSNTYLKTIDKDHQYVIYILNKETGFFWGLIEYPDWSGD
ncbi:MAG: hypothetical protein ABJK28_00090 [Algibacter sp.]